MTVIEQTQTEYRLLMEPYRLQLLVDNSEWFVDLFLNSQITSIKYYKFGTQERHSLNFKTSKQKILKIEYISEAEKPVIILNYAGKVVLQAYGDVVHFIKGFISTREKAKKLARVFENIREKMTGYIYSAHIQNQVKS